METNDVILNVKFCPTCGNKLKKPFNFCNKCGLCLKRKCGDCTAEGFWNNCIICGGEMLNSNQIIEIKKKKKTKKIKISEEDEEQHEEEVKNNEKNEKDKQIKEVFQAKAIEKVSDFIDKNILSPKEKTKKQSSLESIRTKCSIVIGENLKLINQEDGGGTRYIVLNSNDSIADVCAQIKQLYFPKNSLTSLGHPFDYKITLLDFKKEFISSSGLYMKLNDYIKMNGLSPLLKPLFYLHLYKLLNNNISGNGLNTFSKTFVCDSASTKTIDSTHKSPFSNGKTVQTNAVLPIQVTPSPIAPNTSNQTSGYAAFKTNYIEKPKTNTVFPNSTGIYPNKSPYSNNFLKSTPIAYKNQADVSKLTTSNEKSVTEILLLDKSSPNAKKNKRSSSTDSWSSSSSSSSFKKQQKLVEKTNKLLMNKSDKTITETDFKTNAQIAYCPPQIEIKIEQKTPSINNDDLLKKTPLLSTPVGDPLQSNPNLYPKNNNEIDVSDTKSYYHSNNYSNYRNGYYQRRSDNGRNYSNEEYFHNSNNYNNNKYNDGYYKSGSRGFSSASKRPTFYNNKQSDYGTNRR